MTQGVIVRKNYMSMLITLGDQGVNVGLKTFQTLGCSYYFTRY